MTCFNCGQGLLLPGVMDLVGERNGESFTVRMEGLRCAECGFQTADSGQSSEFTRLVSDAYREKHGLLTSAEIRSRRMQLQMTQQQFAEYLGPGIASVKRWESGQIQDKAMDELIRLKTDATAAKQNLEELRRLRIPEQCVLSVMHDANLSFSVPGQYWSDEDANVVWEVSSEEALIGPPQELAA